MRKRESDGLTSVQTFKDVPSSGPSEYWAHVRRRGPSAGKLPMCEPTGGIAIWQRLVAPELAGCRTSEGGAMAHEVSVIKAGDRVQYLYAGVLRIGTVRQKQTSA